MKSHWAEDSSKAHYVKNMFICPWSQRHKTFNPRIHKVQLVCLFLSVTPIHLTHKLNTA